MNNMNEELKTYYKIVALCDDTKWIVSEFQNGRIRFGWSGPGMDLRNIDKKALEKRSPEERMTWRYTQFLLNKLHSGDRLVLQFEQPMRHFLIGEVVSPGYEFDTNARPDFNHIVHCRPLTKEPILIDAQCVPLSLRHDLSKRGQYYAIYPEIAIRQLNRIINERLWDGPEAKATRDFSDDLKDTVSEVRSQILKAIAERWKAKDFERFCELLCNHVPFIEVQTRKDSFKGWDLLLRILNPITGESLLEDVPAQCKNYYGNDVVASDEPIMDLARCIHNSKSKVAYLFILGDLSSDFIHRFEKKQEELSISEKKEIQFVLVDQDLIVDLCLKHMQLIPMPLSKNIQPQLLETN